MLLVRPIIEFDFFCQAIFIIFFLPSNHKKSINLNLSG